jgi:uridine kinase
MAKIKLIFITGASGSGKTTIAARIPKRYPTNPCCIISMDDYYRSQDNVPMHERKLKNYDNPKSVELDLLREHLLQLKFGEVINKPIYDYKAHNRLSLTEKIDPNNFDYIIVEGIFALHPIICDLADLTVYVHTDKTICLKRRLERDQKERGRSESDIIRQYQTQVFPMFVNHVWSSRLNANCLIFNNTNDEDINLTQLFEKLDDMLMTQTLDNARHVTGLQSIR